VKYLGEYINKYYNGFHWDSGGYMFCPAESADDQMHCLHYETEDTIFWGCKFCDGDCCIKRGIR